MGGSGGQVVRQGRKGGSEQGKGRTLPTERSIVPSSTPKSVNSVPRSPAAASFLFRFASGSSLVRPFSRSVPRTRLRSPSLRLRLAGGAVTVVVSGPAAAAGVDVAGVAAGAASTTVVVSAAGAAAGASGEADIFDKIVGLM